MQGLLSNVRSRMRAAMVITATGVMVFGNVASASAASLTSVSLELSDPRPDETAVSYTLNAAGFSGTLVRCLEVEFDTASDGSGGMPSGMVLTGATSSANTINGTLATDVVDNANGLFQFTNATGAASSASGAVTVDDITNPDSEDEFFAIVTTYTDVSCSGGNEVDTATIAWVTKNGEPVQLVIEPSLNFVCNAVASAETVNGATTTVATGASGVDYASTVTAAANGISAHDLDVTTNAAGGYVVYIRHAQDFQNSGSDVIDAHAGTNTAPTSFSAAGTESWGYTTEDITLTTGTADRFDSGNWAGFTTTNEPVIDNVAATAGTDTTRVGHQVGIANTTPAGVYNTEIIYTIVATY